MKPMLIVFAAAALAFGGANDPLAEERHKAKYGRYSPAEEARRREAKKQVVEACHRVVAKPAPVETAADARNKAKYGITFGKAPASEPVETIMTCGDATEPEDHNCRDHACCRHAAAKPAPVETAADARHKAKYGTTFKTTKPAAAPAETVMTCGDESAVNACCGNACCGGACCDGHEKCKRR